MPDNLKKVFDWYSLFDTVFNTVMLCMTRFNVKAMAMFLYNNPKVIPLVVFVFAGLAYGFLRLCGFTYVAVLEGAYHLAGVKALSLARYLYLCVVCRMLLFRNILSYSFILQF